MHTWLFLYASADDSVLPFYGIASSFEKNERYQEEYAEVISEVAHKLTAEHRKIEDALKKN